MRSRVRGYGPAELVGTIQQGDRNIVGLAEDLTNGGFLMPVQATDKALVRGRELAIMAVDDFKPADWFGVGRGGIAGSWLSSIGKAQPPLSWPRGRVR